MPPRRWHRELLGRENVMGLGDPGRVVRQGHGPVVQARVAGGHAELLGGKDVVGRLAVQRRVRGGHAELFGGEHVVGGIVVGAARRRHGRR
ncbi:hypothetical protein [Nocardioides sp.]|uniref:hypothetical protein n=1 Tax=Nocardioides sp. TaxID=35761 RepID=UPI002E3734A7|nr:hypothetical protein [Nocardioides sp.]